MIRLLGVWFYGCLESSAEYRLWIIVKEFNSIREGTYKSNANTTDLSGQLIKTVNEKVNRNRDNRKVSIEKANVVYGGGEVVVFLIAG